MYGIPCPVFPLLLHDVFYSSSQAIAGKQPLSRFFYTLLQGKINSCFQFALSGLQMYANYPFSLLMENWKTFKCTFLRQRPSLWTPVPPNVGICVTQSTVQCHLLPLYWLWRHFQISTGLYKRQGDRLNPSEIQEHYVSFWSSNDAKDSIWVDLRPFEGWGASEQGGRNYILTWEVHCFGKML